jgi:hypothetical protein
VRLIAWRVILCLTSCPPKKAAISGSVVAKAKFPMKAVYGGLVGTGGSSIGGGLAGVEPAIGEHVTCRTGTEALTV